ncbi:MAG: amidohydrolase [Saprospiraceae bacterium]|nr:amidohydrolase [Saprospiraceae bacterium]
MNEQQAISEIKLLSAHFDKEIVLLRQTLHKYPELSFDEKNTSERLKEKLHAHDIEFTTGWAGYGLIANLNPEAVEPFSIAIRADMDALPIHEQNKTSYTSCHPGIMHACGHDVHMAIVMGTALVLNEMQLTPDRRLKILFQPAEEKLPGGALKMIQQGALRNPPVSSIFGLHVEPKMSVGHVGLCKGGFMASSDEIYIRIVGKGGHAAQPKMTNNPIYAASNLIQEMRSLPLLHEPTADTLLSFGRMNTDGGATNIVPETLTIEGTFRSLSETKRFIIHNELKHVALKVEQVFAVQIELEIRKGYPSLYNDPELTQRSFDACVSLLGEDSVHWINPRLTAEDFAYYSHEVPACFLRLGIGKDQGVHHPLFDVDERCLKVGVEVLSWMVCAESSFQRQKA